MERFNGKWLQTSALLYDEFLKVRFFVLETGNKIMFNLRLWMWDGC